MPEITDLKAALKAALAAALPTRVVTRSFLDFALRAEPDLEAGVVTIIGGGEKGYLNTLGRLAQQGTVTMIVVGQVKVTEDATPEDLEDAEDLLADEIKGFCRAPGAGLGGLSILSYRQSGQLEHPYGWVACELELMT